MYINGVLLNRPPGNTVQATLWQSWVTAIDFALKLGLCPASYIQWLVCVCVPGALLGGAHATIPILEHSENLAASLLHFYPGDLRRFLYLKSVTRLVLVVNQEVLCFKSYRH